MRNPRVLQVCHTSPLPCVEQVCQWPELWTTIAGVIEQTDDCLADKKGEVKGSPQVKFGLDRWGQTETGTGRAWPPTQTVSDVSRFSFVRSQKSKPHGLQSLKVGAQKRRQQIPTSSSCLQSLSPQPACLHMVSCSSSPPHSTSSSQTRPVPPPSSCSACSTTKMTHSIRP